MEDRLLILLEDIRLAADDVIRFVKGMDQQAYVTSETTRLAVERQLITAGEAMVQLAKEFPDAATSIPESRDVIGFRNILVHRYRTLDHVEVYGIIRGKLPALREHVAAVIADLEKPE